MTAFDICLSSGIVSLGMFDRTVEIGDLDDTAFFEYDMVWRCRYSSEHWEKEFSGKHMLVSAS